jgi:hypothetical protein
MNVGAKMTEILNNSSKYPVFTSNQDNATVKFSGVDPYLSEFGLMTEGERFNCKRSENKDQQ